MLRWLSWLFPITVYLLLFLLVKGFLLGLGVGVGFLLHWLLPEIDLGMGILIGVVVTGMAIHFFARLGNLAAPEVEEVEEGEGEGEEPPWSRIAVLPVDPFSSRRKRRRRRK